MGPLRSALASAVDRLAVAGRATVTETRTQLALYQLDATGAREVLALLEAADFRLARLADAGGDLRPDDLYDGADGIELVVGKPDAPDHVFPILTLEGFRAALARPPAEPTLWIEGLDRTVETVTCVYAPWDVDADFRPSEESPSPTRVIRDLSNAQPDLALGRWLLRDPEADVSGRALAPWRNLAAATLCAALAQELERDGRLLFRGPPPTRFRGEGESRVEAVPFSGLQRAAAWVYESARELENRHTLLAAEVARTALRDGDLADLASTMSSALEGARIAYGFGVSQQSRDTLKSLGDLRKAVTDETARLSESIRSLATAVTASTVGNVGLIVARLTLGRDARYVAPAAILIGVALLLYVAVVIWSGWSFLSIQRDLRRDWRERLYRFLGDDEYDRMVTTPVGDAERAFKRAAWGGGIVAALLLVALLVIIWHS